MYEFVSIEELKIGRNKNRILDEINIANLYVNILIDFDYYMTIYFILYF